MGEKKREIWRREMKKTCIVLTAVLLMQLCGITAFSSGDNEYTVFMENYDFSEMGMSNGGSMGTVKFPDTQNKNAWGWHGSSDPKTCIYRNDGTESYMEIANIGTTKKGTTYFWNNFPELVTGMAEVSFDIRLRDGKTDIYLMSDSKYDGDETATNVPTDWPNVIMDLVCENGTISFSGKVLLSDVNPDEWCSVTVEADINEMKLDLYAEQNGRSGSLKDVNVTAADKSNVSILSFNPSAGGKIDITNVSMSYYTDYDPDATPKPTAPPVGVVIKNPDDEAELAKTEQLIEERPHMERQMEALDRGLIAVNTDQGVFLSWRLLGTEPYSTGFNVYRNGEKINSEIIAGSTNYIDKNGGTDDVYSVRAVADGNETDVSSEITPLVSNYISIPMNIPESGVTPAGESYTYSVGDCSAGDLDGDGQYELVVMWSPSNANDSSHEGYTGNVYIDAYTLEGNQLWRIDLGKNIRAGAHYTQLMVYDLDGDGISEIACKTGDGTVDGTGNVIGNADADYRNGNGRIITGPEYLTVFDGRNGAEMYTESYSPVRNDLGDDLYKIWGDSNGNRCERYLAAVAYLDGVHPSLITVRGYYTRTAIVAYDFRNGRLEKKWTFDTSINASKDYMGKGNHNLSIGDVDYDGFDEIIFGSALIDHDGQGIDPGLGHGDAMHFGDLDPTRPGMEVFQVHESSTGYVNVQFRDARTNQMIWGVPFRKDIGRGVSADIDPNYVGEECFASDTLYSASGDVICKPSNLPQNFAIWWDGDLQREMADDINIYKYDYNAQKGNIVFKAEGCVSNNGTKSTPALQADLFGDWREEIAFGTADSKEIRIYTTTDITDHKLHTLMHDSVYRMGVAWQNVAYNQPPHTSFYMGYDMQQPEDPELYTVEYNGVSVKNNVEPGVTDTINVSTKLQSGTIAAACYDKSGELIGINMVEADGSGEYELSIKTEGVESISLMVFEDMKTLKPVCRAVNWE